MNFVAAILLAAALPIAPQQAREITGSYRLSSHHVIDIGSMDEAGGALMSIDQKTLRTGILQMNSADLFTAGPSIGRNEPEDIRFKVRRDSTGPIIGATVSSQLRRATTTSFLISTDLQRDTGTRWRSGSLRSGARQ